MTIDETELVANDDSAIGRALTRSVMVVIALLTAIGGGALVVWLQYKPPEAQVVAPVAPTVREKVDQPIPQLPFADITHTAGIDFVHVNGGSPEKLLPETMGGSVCFFDFDNDGDADLLFINSRVWDWNQKPEDSAPATSKLYANDGHGKYEDVSQTAGMDLVCYGMGAAVADFDNDGWNDVFVTTVGKNRLFKNREGKFEEVTESAGVGGAEDAWSTSAAWFDYDNDGLLDLFVCNYVQWSREIDMNQSFTLLGGGGRAYGPPRAFGGTFPYLYHNDGNGKFRDVSAEMGVQVTNRDTGVPLSKGMGVSPVDVDSDGYLDLVVANDTVQNFLLMNQQGKKFVESAEFNGIAYDRMGNARGAMGIDAAILRSDGSLAIGIGNFAGEMSALYMARPRTTRFFDAATATGFGPPTRSVLTFGLFFFDADLDGRLDILGANGHLENEISKVQKSQTYEQPPQLFWNAGQQSTSEFVRVSESQTGAEFNRPMVGRGAAYADIDADGDLDVCIAANGGSPRLLRNDQALNHHWLRLQLVGQRSNRNAIGAVVTVTINGVPQSRIVMPTRSYCSQCELETTFGLGAATSYDSITIKWPSGVVQTVTGLAIDQVHRITESES